MIFYWRLQSEKEKVQLHVRRFKNLKSEQFKRTFQKEFCKTFSIEEHSINLLQILGLRVHKGWMRKRQRSYQNHQARRRAWKDEECFNKCGFVSVRYCFVSFAANADWKISDESYYPDRWKNVIIPFNLLFYSLLVEVAECHIVILWRGVLELRYHLQI